MLEKYKVFCLIADIFSWAMLSLAFMIQPTCKWWDHWLQQLILHLIFIYHKQHFVMGIYIKDKTVSFLILNADLGITLSEAYTIHIGIARQV